LRIPHQGNEVRINEIGERRRKDIDNK
jgi:hypothetical protein